MTRPYPYEVKRLHWIPFGGASTPPLAPPSWRWALALTVALTACGGAKSSTATQPSQDDEDDGIAFDMATYSSPIAMSRSGRLVWAVNPADDSVSVIRTDTNRVVAKIPVGHEPQSVALSPNDKFAYVANAAAGTVTVIRVKDADPDHWQSELDEGSGATGALTTGAEPWNVVASPDGRRVFVANSAQDTITVIDARKNRIIGHVDLRNSLCNDPDRARHFQPRGMAVTWNSKKLYVTRFLSFTRPGGRQGDDEGKEGLVCRLDIDTRSKDVKDYRPAAAVTLGPRITGFKSDKDGDGVFESDTSAFPNQLQSIVIRGDDQAYLPNVAASPSGPLRFDVDTQAFVNVIDGALGEVQRDASGEKFLNLQLGARDPEPGKKKLFFANAWAIAFTAQRGPATGYVVSAGSDLLVKVNVAADGKLSFTVDGDTTRYVDLHDPSNPAASGANAGKNPQGIVITPDGKRAYVANFVSRNVSVVDLTTDAVLGAIQTADLPKPGSKAEETLVGAEMFFSSRGHFDRPAGASADFRVDERLSNAGWQSCSSCHFKGLTDGVVWTFNSGPRKSIPLNGTFSPHGDHASQRILNYSAVRDEVEDFELNIRNVSGPGPLAAAVTCDGGTNPAVPTSKLDPKHGLLVGVGDVNTPPCVINDLDLPNRGRAQLTVTLPGPDRLPVPALTALREWVRLAVRTPTAPVKADKVADGRALFETAGCVRCHGGDQFTVSIKDFTSPPAATETATEAPPVVGAKFLKRFLRDVGSFNLGVPGQGNDIGADIGAPEIATAAVVGGVFDPAPIAQGGNGNGFAVPSLLGIYALPPYGHNGACETLACVLDDVNHRTDRGTQRDVLADPGARDAVEAYLESIDADAEPFPFPGP
jgi:YVTN family beta-propeller protein